VSSILSKIEKKKPLEDDTVAQSPDKKPKNQGVTNSSVRRQYLDDDISIVPVNQ